MKVLQEPKFDWWTYKFYCSECTAQLEACQTDVEAHFHEGVNDCRPGESTPPRWTFSVTCPICTTAHVVPLDKIPAGLQWAAKERQKRAGRS